MFCPGCGIEEIAANQYCRACGADLRRVRTAIESPDQITASAVSARDQIGSAIAGKIKDLRGAEEWSTFAEEVLPEIEKFLESPAEKRLRRIRAGTILSMIGLGATIGITIASMAMGDADVMFIAGLGLVAFFLGLGFILNGMFLTIPRRNLTRRSAGVEDQWRLDLAGNTSDLKLPESKVEFVSSVTEHTTKHLKEKQPR